MTAPIHEGGIDALSRKLPSDPRPFIRLATDVHQHPKLQEIDSPAAGWTYIVSMLMTANSMQNGMIQPHIVLRTANTAKLMVTLRGRRMKIDKALAEQNLWHLPGHDCKRCPQPMAGYAVVHDFLRHQQSAQDRVDYREWKSRAGMAGAIARWGTDEERAAAKAAAKAAATAPAEPDAMAAAMAGPLAAAGKTLATERPELPKRAPAKSRRTRLPDEFTLNEPMRRWAAENAPSVDVDFEHTRFLTHYRGVGEPRGNWSEVWKAWMLRDHKFTAQRRNSRTVYSNGADPAAALRQEEASRG